MQTAYSRVTVVSADRTVDIALPTGLPLGEILPQLMKYAGPESPNPAPTNWTLARLGGAHLPLAQTLAEAAVLDGDVLELRPEGEAARPLMVDDVRDAVEDSVDATGGTWSTRTTGSFVVLAGSLLLALLALVVVTANLLSAAMWPLDVDSIPSSTAAVAVLTFATWWSTHRAREVDAQVAAAVAMVWAAMVSLALCHRLEAGHWVTIAVCAAAAAAIAGVTRLLTPATTGHAAFGCVVLVVAAAMLVAETWEVSERVAPRVIPVLALLAIGAIPRISLSVGGLASADYRVRNIGVLDLVSLQARYRVSNAVLVGSLAAIGLVVAWFGTGLALSGETWDRALSGALAAGLMLRSRVFSRTQHIAPLRIAGIALVAVALFRLTADEPDLMPWLGLIIAAATLAGIGLSSADPSEISRARVKRTLNTVEFLVLVVILVLLCGAIAVYAQFEGIFG